MTSIKHYARWLFKHSCKNYKIEKLKPQAMVDNKFSLPHRFAGFGDSVWNEFTKYEAEYKPLNLGHGFPDFAAPKHVTKSLWEVAQSDNLEFQQYTRDYGHLRLVNIISKLYSKLIGREINPLTEVLVTTGAYEALFFSIQGFTKPGDEVIIIEPYFDCYEPMVVAAGGVPVFIPLRPKQKENGETMTSGDWVLNPEELESKFNSQTKAIVINTPHNPLGKVFTLKELVMIGDLCKKWNVLCIMDEVYEWLVYKPYKHVRMASLPGMWERTITVCSAGKSLGVTGWKIGWAYAPADLVEHLRVIKSNTTFTSATPTQEAIARILELEITRLDSPECCFNELPAQVKPKRDFMANFLTEFGMKPTIPEGGYFMVADWTNLESRINLDEMDDKWRDYKFAKWMSKNVKLQGIPPSAFYSELNKHLGENFIRYCFVKKDETLQKAAQILRDWKENKHETK